MRFDPWVLGLLLLGCGLLGCGLLGCGNGSSGSDEATSDADEGSASAEPHFEVEGRGESAKTSSVLDVVEGQEASRLAITGADGADNLIAIYATFHGVDTVVGSHVLSMGSVDEGEVFAIGTIDGRTYQSEAGELRLSMTS